MSDESLPRFPDSLLRSGIGLDVSATRYHREGFAGNESKLVGGADEPSRYRLCQAAVGGAVMTLTDVQKKINAMKELIAERLRPDHEALHCLQDNLYQEILFAIGEDKAENPKEMAKLALTAEDLEFERWCA